MWEMYSTRHENLPSMGVCMRVGQPVCMRVGQPVRTLVHAPVRNPSYT